MWPPRCLLVLPGTKKNIRATHFEETFLEMGPPLVPNSRANYCFTVDAIMNLTSGRGYRIRVTKSLRNLIFQLFLIRQCLFTLKLKSPRLLDAFCLHWLLKVWWARSLLWRRQDCLFCRHSRTKSRISTNSHAVFSIITPSHRNGKHICVLTLSVSRHRNTVRSICEVERQVFFLAFRMLKNFLV